MGVRRRGATNWIIFGTILVLTALSVICGCGATAPRMREAMTDSKIRQENLEGKIITTSIGEETLSAPHYANFGTIVVPEGSTFSITGANYANSEGSKLLVVGVCNIEGNVENYGNIIVSQKGVLNVFTSGLLTNHATILVQNAGILNVSGTLDNGPLENASGVTFINQRGGEIRTLLTSTGRGTLNNHKVIQNYGLVQNDGAVHCIATGRIDNMHGRGKVQGLPIQEPSQVQSGG